MDKALLQDMLELAKREKARWEKAIRELNAEMKLGSSRPAATGRQPSKREDTKTARTEKDVAQVLASAEEPLSPTQIVEKGKKLGIELPSNMVRQVLSRQKDKLFVSPERGLWTLREKEKAESLPLE